MQRAIKINNGRCSGSLFHFPHFMMDCLFNEITVAECYNYDIVYRRKHLDQSIGIFKKIYEEVMGTRNIEIPESEFNDLSLNFIQPGRQNDPTLENIQKFRDFIFKRYNIHEETDSPEVILIERGDRIELMLDEDLKKINKNITTGKERREITDIQKIKNSLEEKYGNRFRSVILETMDFKDQIRCFKNAKLVIGIHGGGLANILFCNKGTILIEVSGGGDFGWRFLNNSCKKLEIQQIKCENDINEINGLLDNIHI